MLHHQTDDTGHTSCASARSKLGILVAHFAGNCCCWRRRRAHRNPTLLSYAHAPPPLPPRCPAILPPSGHRRVNSGPPAAPQPLPGGLHGRQVWRAHRRGGRHDGGHDLRAQRGGGHGHAAGLCGGGRRCCGRGQRRQQGAGEARGLRRAQVDELAGRGFGPASRPASPTPGPLRSCRPGLATALCWPCTALPCRLRRVPPGPACWRPALPSPPHPHPSAYCPPPSRLTLPGCGPQHPEPHAEPAGPVGARARLPGRGARPHARAHWPAGPPGRWWRWWVCGWGRAAEEAEQCDQRAQSAMCTTVCVRGPWGGVGWEGRIGVFWASGLRRTAAGQVCETAASFSVGDAGGSGRGRELKSFPV